MRLRLNDLLIKPLFYVAYYSQYFTVTTQCAAFFADIPLIASDIREGHVLPHTLTAIEACVPRACCAHRPGKRRACLIAWAFLYLYVSLLASGLHAQMSAQMGIQMNSSRFVLSTVTTKTGLPEGAILSLAQTSDGYLWLGTDEGLARYDGVSLTMFTTDTSPGLGNDAVYSLAPGPGGSLWIGTLSGVSLYKGGVFHQIFSTTGAVIRLFRERDDRVWAGTMGAGLYSVQGGRVRAYHTDDGIPGRFIYAMAQTPDGSVWFGTDHGLIYYEGGKFRSYGARNGPFGGHIRGLAVANDGSLWIAAVAPTLYRLHGGRLTATPLPDTLRHARVYSLFADRQGGLWSLYNHDGAALLQGGRWTRYTTAQGLPGNDASLAIEDREGDVWLGTLEGATELRQGVFSRFGPSEGLSEPNVWTVLQARDGSLWVGTNSKGLDHIDKDGRVRVYGARDGLPPVSIYALSESPDGSLWIGFEHGTLSHLSHDRITSFHDPDGNTQNLNAILQDPSGGRQSDGLLLGQYRENGLVRFSQGRLQHSTVPGQINVLARGTDGSIWVGTDHGGLSHIAQGMVKTYTVQSGLSSNFIVSLYVDRQGVVWAGTMGHGLNRLENGHITQYGTAQGLFSSTAGGILEDDEGYLWFTSESGIYKVRKQELTLFAEGRIASVHSVSYGLADGLTTLDCNYGPNPSVWRGLGGRLYFATSNGIVSVDPAHSRVAASSSPVLVQSVLVNQTPQAFRNGLRLQPGAADLEIRYTQPEFAATHPLHFRYRLSGFDRHWVDVGGRRSAYYTHLPPGRYVFEVEAAENTGEWNGAPAQLNVVLLPFFWQTGWFHALAAALLLLAAVVVYRLRLRWFVARNHELEEKVRARTGELEEALQSLTTAHAALYEQATRDSLTRLWNRQSIFEKLAVEHARAQADASVQPLSAPSSNASSGLLSNQARGLSLVMADIDHFKAINDTYGHQTGDLVLQEVAARISGLTREGEFAGRYGGEEFIVIFPNCSRDNAARRAEQLRHAIAETPVQTDLGPLQTSCSFGVSAICFGATVASLVAQADAALYEAKRAGRNRVVAGDCTPIQDAAISRSC